ncbi:MAG: ATP-binding cassette domain-containing protein [Gammaproteobacteria bacterium]
MENKFLISAKNISYKINDNKLFHNLSFDLEEGEAIHICGENGSGKSTLLRILLGITNQTKGGIEKNLQKEVCFLGHKNAVKSYLSLQDNILLMELHNDPKLQKYINLLNLKKYLNVVVANLSFGQQKKTSIVKSFP